MTNATGYVYPALGGNIDLGLFRIGGPGLGNCLLCWARASVAADLYSLTRIAPAWPAFKLARLLRRDGDPRFYAHLFDDEADAIAGPAKLALLACGKKRKFTLPSDLAPATKPIIHVARGNIVESVYFSELFDHRSSLRRRLVKMTKPSHLEPLENFRDIDLAVHVRLGDFLTERADGSFINRRIPVAWFCRQIGRLQSEVGRQLNVVVFSDGRAEELTELTDIRGVRLSRTGNPICDLYALASAKCLIASPSTFSMWAAYLGGAPSVWYPNAHLQQIGEARETEIEHSGEGPYSPGFLAGLVTSLAGRSGQNRGRDEWLRLAS